MKAVLGRGRTRMDKGRSPGAWPLSVQRTLFDRILPSGSSMRGVRRSVGIERFDRRRHDIAAVGAGIEMPQKRGVPGLVESPVDEAGEVEVGWALGQFGARWLRAAPGPG
jgi:hypothetical protein